MIRKHLGRYFVHFKQEGKPSVALKVINTGKGLEKTVLYGKPADDIYNIERIRNTMEGQNT